MRYIVRPRVSRNLLLARMLPQSAVWLSGGYSFVLDDNLWAVSRHGCKILSEVSQDVEDCGSRPKVVEGVTISSGEATRPPGLILLLL